MTGMSLSTVKARLKRAGFGLLLLGVGIAIGSVAVGIFRSAAVDPQAKQGAAPVDEAEHFVWTCSMHPQIRRPEPGRCPICGMDLVPVAANEGTGSDDAGRVVLSERARALAGLRTEAVRRRGDATAGVRLLGRVEPDEETLKTVTAWIGGRIDRLHVKTTGERVRAGQVIATLYSPEVFAAHQDLLVARRQADRMASGAPSSLVAATAALEAARDRLRLLGLPDGEVSAMESQGRPTRAVPIRTPFGGTVMERLATEGAYVTTGAPLYRVANLSNLWIQLDAYESDLPRLAVGQRVRVEMEGSSGEAIEGAVTFIDPALDPERRTARVRVEVENRDGRLRPGTFVQAVVVVESKQGADAPLVVPSTAPLFTGRRAIVYVEVAAGEDRTGYEPRTVRLGPRLGIYYPVVAGLSEGERIVTHGAFAIDADLQIRGGASMMASPDDSEPGTWDDDLDVPRDELRRVSPVVDAYLSVQRALAADDLPKAQAAAVEMGQHLSKVVIERPAPAGNAWDELSSELDGQARHVAGADSIEHARMGFEDLSDSIATLLRKLGNPLDRPLVQVHCPMAFGSRGADWIQQGTDIDNPYFGASMRTCGEVRHSVAPGSRLPLPGNPIRPAPGAPPVGGHRH
ncbi:MAG TPA: efflux RND transporter periplasmic adaptor subunit [Polyangia bacterium]|nr:efflux RND transporter periplasmic adaptor subunit [Polyangia bacterium]